jgi:hypothetical protein
MDSFSGYMTDLFLSFNHHSKLHITADKDMARKFSSDRLFSKECYRIETASHLQTISHLLNHMCQYIGHEYIKNVTDEKHRKQWIGEMTKIIYLSYDIKNIYELVQEGKLATQEQYTYLFAFFEVFHTSHMDKVLTQLCFGQKYLLDEKTKTMVAWNALCCIFTIGEEEASLRQCVDEYKAITTLSTIPIFV